VDELNAQVRAITAGRVMHVLLAGEIDVSEADHIRGVLQELIAASPPEVLAVNLRAVAFFGASGLTCLLEVRQQVRRGGGTVLITDSSRCVNRLIRMCGLAEHLGLDNELTGPPQGVRHAQYN